MSSRHNSCIATGRGSLKFRGSMLGGVASSCSRFETVTVGIENVRSVITGIVIQARAGLAVVGRARRHCCLVERVHLGLALGDKADMRSPGVGIALPEPEKYAAVPSEALEVGMPLGAILGRHRLVEKRQVEVYDVHEFELGVGPLFRDFVDPFGDGLAVATGPRASEDDGNSQ